MKIAGEYSVPPDEVFRDGQAFCPEHDTPLTLRGVESGSGTETFVRVRMFCVAGRHWIVATFEARGLLVEDGLNFRVQYGDRIGEL